MWKISSAIGAGSGISSMSRWYVDVGIATDLVGERLECLGEPLGPQRRPVQVSDQRTDAVGGLLLGLADLLELIANRRDVVLLEELARHVDLDREPEEHLRQVVVEVPGDLQPFVCTLLRHRVRQRLEHLLAILELLVRLLERLRPEEHLPRKEQAAREAGTDPGPTFTSNNREGETKNRQSPSS